MFEIHMEAGDVLVCRTLKSAVARQEDLKQFDQRHSLWVRTTWLVDTKATESYSVPHPSKRLKGPVFVRHPSNG
jgi:hypothetical protein